MPTCPRPGEPCTHEGPQRLRQARRQRHHRSLRSSGGRVGRSRLVQEFCDSSRLPYCFYQALQRPRDEALAEFGEAVAQSTLDAAETFAGASCTAWPTALKAACAGAPQDRPMILVIDDLPDLAEHDNGFASDLQKAWDRGIERMPVPPERATAWRRSTAPARRRVFAAGRALAVR